MVELRPRETVILATDFSRLVDWYRDVLGFTVVRLFEDDFHFCNPQTSAGIRIGIGDAKEMGVVPGDRQSQTVILQFEVDDVQEFFAHLEQSGTEIVNGPAFDKNDGFWFGSFADPEGNSCWVVDRNWCRGG